MKTYPQALEYMYRHLPMYQRIGAAAYKTGLQTTLALCKHIGNPQFQYKTIHIAGTNGKGSTSHLLASILQSSGLKTGLYTSPHLKDFRERILINGRMIPKAYVTQFIKEHKDLFEELLPSFFEMTFSMAVKYFAECNIDTGVFEVGMGGRLDSTNVIKPEVSIITNIGLDHTFFLGDTLNKIAAEKAGIIKKEIPVVIGETHVETQAIFLTKAYEEHCQISFADEHFKVKKVSTDTIDHSPTSLLNIYKGNSLFLNEVSCPLGGNYQTKNIATVLQATEILKGRGYHLNMSTIRKGIENVVRNTGFKGRWQLLRRKPLTICDTAHNEDGITEVLQQIKKTPYKKLHFVIGMVNDKDVTKILALLPKKAIYYFCKPDIPRGLDQNTLFQAGQQAGLQGEAFPSVRKAYQQALLSASDQDMVFVGGSTFVVAEVL